MNPVKTLCFTLSLVALLAASAVAQTRTLYFYPPDAADWIAGRSYIFNGSTPTALQLADPVKMCGWYKVTFTSTPPTRAQFWLGQGGQDKIGPKGRLATDFDPGVNFINEGGVFDLSAKFPSGINTMYFVADELDPSNAEAGWYRTDPGIEDNDRCSFNLAAFIYDTDISVHPDFSCGEYDEGSNGDNGPKTRPNCTLSGSYSSVDAYTRGGNLKGQCTGVRRGVVQSTLGADKKIKYNASGDKWKCWTSEDWFNKAFNETEGVNVRRCYDMPFKQKANGAFEFDSDSMMNANNRLVGGFFPQILTNRTGADYSKCPNCDAKRPAECFAPLIKQVNVTTFDNYDANNGDFSDGDTPSGAAFGATGKNSIWNWAEPNDAPDGKTTRQSMNWYLHGTTALSGKDMAPANLFFCFESHAEFIYDSAQVFYFRGDDDIWVYINNKLVIDLGGGHLAAPGHIKLSTITPALEPGKEYPIDIFFCDRRSTMSNVRISTNMYVKQKSNFWSIIDADHKREQPMCAEVSGGSDCASRMTGSSNTGQSCGENLIAKNYKIEYYMLARGNTRDTIWLGPRNDKGKCTGSVNNWTCYGNRGITGINGVYTCGGKNQCKGEETAFDGLAGNYNVYARLLNPQNQVTGKPILIDNIRSASNTRIVWGTLTPWEGSKTPAQDLKDSYGNKTIKEQNIIAGRRTPIHISSGSWDDVGSFTSFSYDDSSTVGFSITSGTGLKIYESETGGTGTQSYSGNLVNGLATLWVEGSYDMGNKSFELNVASNGTDSPPLTINVYQPELRFVEKGGTTPISNPDGWSRWKTTSNNTDQPPFVGASLDVYLVAWDDKRNELCKTCEFSLKTTSTTNNSAINGKWKEGIVTSNATRITAGIANVYLSGADEVLKENRAEWEVWGPTKELTHTKWTGLQFRTSPVPTPVRSIIFDRNGDGIGDSLVVEFNRSFRRDTTATSGELNDSSLIVLLEVAWAPGEEPIRFHAPEYSVDQLKNKAEVLRLYKTTDFFRKNRDYWNDMIKGKNLVVVTAPAFSKDIQTRSAPESIVSSYTPFYERDLCVAGVCPDAAFNYDVLGSKRDILDGIPPVVVKAEYTYVSSNASNCLDGSDLGCKETFIVTLSEPVFAGPDAADNTDARKNPFKYCFGRSQGENCPVTEIDASDRLSQTFDNNNWAWENPQQQDYSSLTTYKPANTKNSPTAGMTNYAEGVSYSSGDSIVDMLYYSKKINADKTTRTPKSDDWVKLRTDYKIFQDAAGNFANPRERGVLVTGINPSRKKQIKIAQVIADPKAPVLGGTFTGERDGEDYYPNWISDATKNWANDNLFKGGNVAEFLPIPNRITNPDTIKAYYPGSVGTLFDISDRLRQDLSKFVQSSACTGGNICTIDGKELIDKNGNLNADLYNLAARRISIHADAFYHTNLGDYTAHRNGLRLDCTSDLFKNGAGIGDCISNNYNFYLAWDLKTNAGRFVGAGAYVGIAKFYWQLEYEKNGSTKTEKFGRDEAIEMFGVRRVPK
jgi:fibro-slime domain-containing protein